MGRSVCPAEPIEHEFSLVVELQAEPIPSDQILVESAEPNSWSIQLVPVTSNDSFPIVSLPVVASLVKE